MKFKQLLSKFKPREKCVALDIGSAAVKVLELTAVPGGLVVSAAGYSSLPPGTFSAQQIHASHDLIECVRRAFVAAGLKPATVVSCLSGQNLVVRELKLPQMSDKELQAALQLNLEEYLPVKRQSATVDFDKVGEQAGEMEVLVFAAERRPIERYLETLHQAKIRVAVMDILPYALLRAAAFCSSDLETRKAALMLVDFGAESTKVSIFARGRLKLFRIVPIGGGSFTRLFMQTGQLDYQQAEQIKHTHGLNGHLGDPLLELRNNLFDEIWRSLRYVLAQNRNLPLRRIMLSGGGSAMPGLVSQLSRYLTIQVENFGQEPQFTMERLHIWDCVKLAPQINLPVGYENVCFATALGLALGGVT